MPFPQHRLRRLRRTPALRRLVAETRLGVDDLVAPLFVREGLDQLLPEVHLELARGLAGDTLVCSAFCVSICTFVSVKQVN